MKVKKFKRGSFVLVTEYESFVRNKIGVVLNYTPTKTIVYIIDIDFTAEIDNIYLKEV